MRCIRWRTAQSMAATMLLMLVANDGPNTRTAYNRASGAFSEIAAVTAVPWPRRSAKSPDIAPASSMPMPPATLRTCGWPASTPLSTIATRMPRPVPGIRSCNASVNMCRMLAVGSKAHTTRAGGRFRHIPSDERRRDDKCVRKPTESPTTLSPSEQYGAGGLDLPLTCVGRRLAFLLGVFFGGGSALGRADALHHALGRGELALRAHRKHDDAMLDLDDERLVALGLRRGQRKPAAHLFADGGDIAFDAKRLAIEGR